MKFTIWHGHPEKQSTDCIITGIYEKNKLSKSATLLNKSTHGMLHRLAEQGDLRGKIAETYVLHHLTGSEAQRVLLVGAGKEETLSLPNYRKMIAASMQALLKTPAEKVLFCLTELPVEGLHEADKIRHAIDVMQYTLYEFDHYRSEKSPKRKLHSIEIYTTDKKHTKAAEKALAQGLAIADGVKFTRDLANQPANVCTPTWVANRAKAFAAEYSNIKMQVLDEKEMLKLGMGAMLAVAAGSEEPPKLVSLEYKGTAKKQAPIVLVGKGITFDTGGLSLKPADSMVGMKYDMCGAATVLGTMKAAAEMKLPIHLVGILALAENMPSGKAVRPEDIVTSLSGQTIEILNTDAEGRLVLCDALTYAERYKPDVVIDIATLTGAVVIALGQHATGVLSNHQPLADKLLDAGKRTHDRAWQLPLWEDYQDQLKSPFADMSNVGGRSAGTITAACFLSRFTKKYHWAHLDVAGTAAMMMGGSERYATGRPVPLLAQYLIDRS
ncbi:MAG: leucyl aminopeptidase [Gammaproteobacteria bacterium]|nr:leucyl aminopeptidase [Gammaproteobacteria bacterium]